MGRYALAGVALVLALSSATGATAVAQSKKPSPPQIPESFTWTGTYEVPDLDLEVPFTWTGDGNGNMQMTAGDESSPIHFTNLIDDGVLYTLTYTWPGIERRPCSAVSQLTLDDLNAGLAKARFVGPETLDREKPRKVNHFRVGVVFEPPPGLLPEIPGVTIRIPLMSGDLYTARNDPEKVWQVLQFGIQNLYDPEQDEWIFIDKISSTAGDVELPQECAEQPAPPPTTPSTTAPAP
jgi:hypothetical protein